MTTGKTIALARRTFVGKVMLLNMLSRLVITFLPRSKHHLISWLQSPSAVILEPQKINYLGGNRDITLPTKVRLVKAMVFPVVMYRCESWTIRKAECQRIDALKLWF